MPVWSVSVSRNREILKTLYKALRHLNGSYVYSLAICNGERWNKSETNDGRETQNVPVKCKGMNNKSFCWEHGDIGKNSVLAVLDYHRVIVGHRYDNIIKKVNDISGCMTQSIFTRDGKVVMFRKVRLDHMLNTEMGKNRTKTTAKKLTYLFTLYDCY